MDDLDNLKNTIIASEISVGDFIVILRGRKITTTSQPYVVRTYDRSYCDKVLEVLAVDWPVLVVNDGGDNNVMLNTHEIVLKKVSDAVVRLMRPEFKGNEDTVGRVIDVMQDT